MGQNLLNRNPNSTLASASGLHPFFRLLFTNYGERHCLNCGEAVRTLSEDEIVERLVSLSKMETIRLYVPLVHGLQGGHQTLLRALEAAFDLEKLVVDGAPWDKVPLDPIQPHSIQILTGVLDGSESLGRVRELVQTAAALGAGAVRARGQTIDQVLSPTLTCTACGTGLGELRATHLTKAVPTARERGVCAAMERGSIPRRPPPVGKGCGCPNS